MLRNADGTICSGETVAEEIARRFETTQYPYLSDILGSDWGANRRDGESLEGAAYRIAQGHYDDDAGCLEGARRLAAQREEV